MNANKTISIIAGTLVLFLAVGSFVLSYDALRGLAETQGLKSSLSWMFPIIVDGFIIVASLSVLRNSLLSEPARYPWGLVMAFTTLSVVFNVAHSPSNWLARIIAAVPPVTLLLSFELLMGQIKSEVTRRETSRGLAELSQQVATHRTERDRLAAEMDKLTARLEQARAEMAGLPQDKCPSVSGNGSGLSLANDARQAKIAARRQQVQALLSEDMSEKDIAGQLDVSLRTIRRDIKALDGRAAQ